MCWRKTPETCAKARRADSAKPEGLQHSSTQTPKSFARSAQFLPAARKTSALPNLPRAAAALTGIVVFGEIELVS
jgi:hypothetical protein